MLNAVPLVAKLVAQQHHKLLEIYDGHRQACTGCCKAFRSARHLGNLCNIHCIYYMCCTPSHSPLVSAPAGAGAAAVIVGCQPVGRNFLSAVSTLAESATAPNTPPCIVTILMAAAWLPVSVAAVQSAV